MGPKPLIDAIAARDVPRALALIDEQPATASEPADDGTSPLMQALYHRLPDVVDALLGAGVEPDVHEAAALGDTDRVRALLDAEPGLVKAHSPDGWTALHLAAHFGRARTAVALIDRGADVGAAGTNAMANTPLHAAAAGASAAVAGFLLEAGADADARDSGDNTPLHIAAAGGAVGVAEALLEAGAATDVVNDGGDTPLDVARHRGQGVVEALLSE